MDAERISLEVGYGGEKITFHLHMISMQEEQRYTQRFADIVEKDSAVRAEREYFILVDGIASWSIDIPTKKGGKTGDEDVALIDDYETPLSPAETVRKYFEERTGKKERILNQAVAAFRNRMVPDVSFL